MLLYTRSVYCASLLFSLSLSLPRLSAAPVIRNTFQFFTIFLCVPAHVCVCWCRDKTSSSLDRTKNRTPLSIFLLFFFVCVIYKVLNFWVLNLRSLCFFQLKIIFCLLHLPFNFFPSSSVFFFFLIVFAQKFHLKAVGYLIFCMHM